MSIIINTNTNTNGQGGRGQIQIPSLKSEAARVFVLCFEPPVPGGSYLPFNVGYLLIFVKKTLTIPRRPIETYLSKALALTILDRTGNRTQVSTHCLPPWCGISSTLTLKRAVTLFTTNKLTELLG
jgi:hypothetical protein